MSKYDMIREIRIELERLNQVIDLKIIKGTSYKREATRHKFLSRQLMNLTQRERSGWINSAMNYVSTFMF